MVDRKDVMYIIIQVRFHRIKAVESFFLGDQFFVKRIFDPDFFALFVGGFPFYKASVVVRVLFIRGRAAFFQGF